MSSEICDRTFHNKKQRVELHAHTNMTKRLGLCSEEDLIDRAIAFGNKAVAITDIGSVQAFPNAERYNKAVGSKIKIIYGWEAEFSENHCGFTVLVKNQQGLKKLYKAVSLSLRDKNKPIPTVSKKLFLSNRSGLLLGCSLCNGELLNAILNNKPWSELCKIAKYYDFLEILPTESLEYLLRNEAYAKSLKGNTDLKKIIRTIVRLGEELEIPVCAAGDVYYIDLEDKAYESILMYSNGSGDKASHVSKFFMTTGEMLNEFSYLGEEKAYEVVVENTNLIADMIEEIEILPTKKILPVIDNAKEALTELVMKKAKELYGTPLPELIENRISCELKSITENDFTSLYEIARLLVKESERKGYHTVARATLGSSLVAFLSGITDINPLPAHYICPKCHNIEFVPSVSSGYDLPDKLCSKCSEKMKIDGHNIPFEAFFGIDGNKAPDISINFATEISEHIKEYTAKILGNDFPVYAGAILSYSPKTAGGYIEKYYQKYQYDKIDKERAAKMLCNMRKGIGYIPGKILITPSNFDIEEITPIEKADTNNEINVTHLPFRYLSKTLSSITVLSYCVPDMYHYLENATGVRVKDIPMNDAETLSLLTSPKALGVKAQDIFCPIGTLALPELRTQFAFDVITKCKPKCFSDAVKISGLTHGTGVWTDNADAMIDLGITDIKDVIATREDIFNKLLDKAIDRQTAFEITKAVRSGKSSPLSDEHMRILREHGVENRYIYSMNKIRYLFPKAHAVSYISAAMRLGWYKIHYPIEFYTAFFNNCQYNEAITDTVILGKAAVAQRIQEIMAISNKTQDESNELSLLLVFNEAMARGIEFLPPDISYSKKNIFTVQDGKIRFPISSH